MFFANEQLLGGGISADHLQDDRLEQALVHFYDYGVTQLGTHIMAVARVMALCLLVYTVAQRQLRQALSQAETGIPHQRGQLTDKPTMRSLFQCFQALPLLRVAGQKQISNLTPQ